MQQASVEVSEVIGSLGRYQLCCVLMCLYALGVTGFMGVFVQLLAPEVTLTWQPDDPEDRNNLTFVSFKSTTCKMEQVYGMNATNHTLVYTSSYSRSTLTEKLGLVCEDSWLVSLSSSVIMVGAVIATVIFGQISERYGRRKVILFLTLPIAAANLCVLLLADSLAVLLVACFIYGAASFSLNNAAFITVVEASSVSIRPIVGCLAMVGLVIGQALIAGLAWATRHWFYLQLAHLIFVTAPLLFAWYYLESPVWLGVRGRDEEARVVLRKIASRNKLDSAKVEPKIDMWLQSMKRRMVMQQSGGQEGNFCDLFKTPTITAYTIAISLVQFSLWLMFFGLSMNVESLGSDLFSDLLSGNGLALLSCVLTIICLSRVPVRRMCYISVLLLTLVCTLYPFLYGNPWWRSALSGLARFCIAPPMAAIVVYAAEIFPTSVRSIGFGFATMTGRAGAIVSPFIREIGVMTAMYVPFILFAALSLISAALLIFVLPETRGKPLPQTIQDLNKTPRKSVEGEPTFLRTLLDKL